jgi:hypothetical protein
VDKTGFALHLIEQGSHYFLSRPRRFGKSLFLDTLAELFEGNEALFQGLAAHSRWDWGRRFPVVRLSFAEGVLRDRAELDARIDKLLRLNAERLGLVLPDEPGVAIRFSELIRLAHARHGERVVVLVDEYDKPILDNLADADTARAMRDGLRNLYSVIKGADAEIRFAFLTGVSKFSKVSLFSGLNNLNDITVDPQLLGHLRLHRGRSGSDLRAGAARPGPGADPRLVQRLQLDRRGGLQPLRRAAAVPEARSSGPGGSRPPRRPSWSICCTERRTWLPAARPAARERRGPALQPSTWTTSPPRRCCFRPAT